MSAAKNTEEEQEGFSVWTPLLLLLLARWSANLKDEGNRKAALSMLVMVLARALPPDFYVPIKWHDYVMTAVPTSITDCDEQLHVRDGTVRLSKMKRDLRLPLSFCKDCQ